MLRPRRKFDVTYTTSAEGKVNVTAFLHMNTGSVKTENLILEAIKKETGDKNARILTISEPELSFIEL